MSEHPDPDPPDDGLDLLPTDDEILGSLVPKWPGFGEGL
jgi:hypothetical protein